MLVVGDATEHVQSTDPEHPVHEMLKVLRASICPRAHHAMLSSGLPSHQTHLMPAGALLAALVAGDAAEDFERADPKESTRKVLEVLRSMFAPKGINIPAPLQVLLTAP